MTHKDASKTGIWNVDFTDFWDAVLGFSKPGGPTYWETIHVLLAVAQEVGDEAAVATYVVGIVLQGCFLIADARNMAYDAADEIFHQNGAFQVGRTIYHVTASPTRELFKRYRRNLQEGFRVYLLVPDRMIVGARQNAELTSAGNVVVRSIESFAAQNINEIAGLLQDMQAGEIVEILESYLQADPFDSVFEFHKRQPITIGYDRSKATWQVIHDLLVIAERENKSGAVVQHLVGANLELRFPHMLIGRESSSTADVQLGRQGDFLVGDMAIHVTDAPMPAAIEKCLRSIEVGLRAILLVPDDELVGARQNAKRPYPGKIAVESIESFVANNIEEIAVFDGRRVVGSLRRLLEVYNERVASVEYDKSLMIEIPPALAGADPGALDLTADYVDDEEHDV